MSTPSPSQVNRQPRGRRFLAKLLALVISTGLSVGVLEVGARLIHRPSLSPDMLRTHSTRRYVFRPEARDLTLGVLFSITSAGLRGVERLLSTGDGAYRVAIYGDSITFDHGARLDGSPAGRMVKDLLRSSYLVDWVRYVRELRRSRSLASSHDRLTRIEPFYEPDSPGWKEAQQAFGEARRLCEAAKIPLLVAIYTNSAELAPTLDQDRRRPVVKTIRGALRAQGIQYELLLDDACRRVDGSAPGRENSVWSKESRGRLVGVIAGLEINYDFVHPIGWSQLGSRLGFGGKG